MSPSIDRNGPLKRHPKVIAGGLWVRPREASDESALPKNAIWLQTCLACGLLNLPS